MANSLNWDGDSWYDFADWLKQQFAIEIPNEELPAINNVGDLYDEVMLHMPVHPANLKCSSAMAFYKLRRALNDLRRPVAISPATPLSSVDPRRLREALNGLDGGLHVPRARPSRSQSWTAIIAVYSALFFVMFGLIAIVSKGDIPVEFLAILLSASVVGLLLLRLFPKRAPADCNCVGDLAKRIASYNYGLLVKRGAKLTDNEVWGAVCAALAQFAAIPQGEIARETTFFRKSPKKKAA